MKNISFWIILTWIGFTTISNNPVPSYGTWIEDSLGLEFQYPRGWFKTIERSPSNLVVMLEKDNKAILRIDTQERPKNWDTDRFIEENLDLYLRKFPDLRVIQEVRLGNEYNGFDEAHFLVIHYHEDNSLVTNRFIFAKKDTDYFIIQAKVIRKHYYTYRNEVDLFMKSFHWESPSRTRWRNDSLSYLNPSQDETTIKYIRDTLRPKESNSNFFRPSNSFTPNADSPSSENSKRPIRDLEPGKNPPSGGVEPVPVQEPSPEPI
ncbi:hypothetical protein [Leptospira sp. GIMC2001]|uniref:hypothetical protein n=1 Tax=Leptospira sp. GIMC2001 TaxID=1513297 RepID=UPI00234A8897|nr:hypothetical protein [Leptospira sp. GIMC2001]WCL49936.1 hypothetical protein O4O04_03710 [Leptospira sp. GIMC2001]